MTTSTNLTMMYALFMWLAAAQCGSNSVSQPQPKACDCDGPTRKAVKDIEAVVQPALREGTWFLYARGLNGGEDTRRYSLCDSFPTELQREGVHILIQDSDLPNLECPGVRRASSSLRLNKYQLIKIN